MGGSAGVEFEEKVRAIARARWFLSPGSCGSRFLDGVEIDCVCETEDVIHLIECTTSRKQDKVVSQVNDLLHAKRYWERRGDTVAMWIVTFEAPTPQQREAARSSGVKISTLAEFSSRLLDSRTYLNLRKVRPFGSAVDPGSEGPVFSDDEYVPQGITDAESCHQYTPQNIADKLCEGAVIVVTGPFGIGKSLTVRELFLRLMRRRDEGTLALTPVALNLREHWGQSDPVEVLVRHATSVGLESPQSLVRAWNAGQVLTLLDGFDEMTGQVWGMRGKAQVMRREARRRAVSVIRAFVQDAHRRGIGCLVAGRDGYFDSGEELRSALGLPNTAVMVTLAEFTEEQALEYLRKRTDVPGLPGWLPRKPLLLAYLVAGKLLGNVLAIDEARGVAYAWDEFLSRVCEREATAAKGIIDSKVVRRVLELLAAKARAAREESGPVFEEDMTSAFRNATGYEPTEEALLLLRRLPGLTVRDAESGGRWFVDHEMQDVLQAIIVADYIAEPFTSPVLWTAAGGHERWRHPLSEFGCSAASYFAESLQLERSQVKVAAREAVRRHLQPTLAMDVVLTGAALLRERGEGLDFDGLVIDDGEACVIALEDITLSGLTLRECIIRELRLPSTISAGVVIEDCVIGRLRGAAGHGAVPSWIKRTSVEEFDSTLTNTAILQLGIPVAIRVLLTILRKVFLQAGHGRLESALVRGLPDHARQYVTPVLDILRAEGMAFDVKSRNGVVWHGSRKHRARALTLLEQLQGSDDPLIERVRRL